MSRPVACSTHLIYIDLIALTTFGGEYIYSFEVKQGGICYNSVLALVFSS
jgi:hypothetical protein